ncbi:hypothetical protein [Actinacidiphila oryziradicis]|uniref:Uncharacterized protein n=1 Tax=Actinacidiphila oryziradicis TaxID=2571141 RepID=A0A4U0SJP9_9ACTN|nr:hypothetical protein [Actinacidiphila oryziradicis]TKA09363.1 hypothetical protein FCI23_22460 [Actinacidiphila oryziradicis]
MHTGCRGLWIPFRQLVGGVHFDSQRDRLDRGSLDAERLATGTRGLVAACGPGDQPPGHLVGVVLEHHQAGERVPRIDPDESASGVPDRIRATRHQRLLLLVRITRW